MPLMGLITVCATMHKQVRYKTALVNFGLNEKLNCETLHAK